MPVFGNGLKAHVAKDGRLVQVDGSPLRVASGGGCRSRPRGQCRRCPRRGGQGRLRHLHRQGDRHPGGATRTTTFSDGGNAKLVWFQTAGGPRLAWQTVTARRGLRARGRRVDRPDPVPAEHGRHRTAARSGPTTRAHRRAARRRRVSLTKWLPNDSPRLAGNVAHVYSDVNDDNVANPSEEVAPSARRRFDVPVHRLHRHGGRQLLGRAPVLLGPEDAELLAGEPGAERGPDVLLPRAPSTTT